MAMRLIVGITGATGAIYGVRLLERLRDAGVETHLVISRWGARTLLHETPYTREQVEALAHTSYAPGDMGAAISSGSFQTSGMIIAPCSAKTLAAIAHGYRRQPGSPRRRRRAQGAAQARARGARGAAQRHSPREHAEAVAHGRGHPAARCRPSTTIRAPSDELVDHTVARMLDQFGIEMPGAVRWTGEMGVGGNRPEED